MPQEFQRIYDSGGGSRDVPVSGGSNSNQLFPIPGFKPCVLPAYPASSTATRTSNIVTVTATAHGIVAPLNYNNTLKVFYPGSPSLTAGWYENFTYIGANSFSFFAPGSNFGSESINAGAAYNSLTTAFTFTLPANTLKDNSILSLLFQRDGDTNATSKIVYAQINGISTYSNLTSTPVGVFEIPLIFTCGRVVGLSAPIGTSSSNVSSNPVDITIPITIDILMRCFTSPGCLVLAAAKFKIE